MNETLMVLKREFFINSKLNLSNLPGIVIMVALLVYFGITIDSLNLILILFPALNLLYPMVYLNNVYLQQLKDKELQFISSLPVQKNNLVAIEVKIKDWKTALHQAYSNLYVADYSHVALWHHTIPNVDFSIFQQVGIGILEVNGSCEQKLKPKKSKLVISKNKRYAKNQCLLQEIDYFV